MEAPGRLVKVNDTYIHVYRIPQRPVRKQGVMVFLAGFGTECPTYDFKPLWQRLTGRYDMVVVERPGYGWSGQTKYPRDIDTVLEETREALRQADFKAPFVPVPHSLSGLEAIYWAQKYPNEVLAIIGLDMVVPAVYDTMQLPKLLSLQVGMGHLLRKPIAKAMAKSHPAVKSGLLDEEEQKAMQSIMVKQLLSQNMIDESSYVKENARKVTGRDCPSIPVLCCLSTDKSILKRIPSWGQAHRDYFASNGSVEFSELPCGHYVHREAPEILAESIVRFLGRLPE